MDDASTPARFHELARILGELDLGLSPEAGRLRDRAVRIAGEYLGRRSDDAARVVAVVGASGVGKSTIVNALAGGAVSPPGERRPTTLEPVVWVDGDLPPTLDGLRRTVVGWTSRGGHPPPAGVVVIDTPPPDVVSQDGTSKAEAVVDVADACVLVVSAARYADAPGVELALRAAERGLPVNLVVNRLPPEESMATQVVDAAETLMRERGVFGAASGPTHAVTETAEGAVSRDEVAGLASAIAAWGTGPPPAAHGGSVELVERLVAELRPLLTDLEARRVAMASTVDAAYRTAAKSFAAEVEAGRFAGAVEDRVLQMLIDAVVRHTGRAAVVSARAWEASMPARVAGHPELFVVDPATPSAAAEAIERWASADELVGRARRLRAVWVSAAIGGYDAVARRRRRRAARIGLVALARDGLVAAAASVLERDSRRFIDLLGRPIPLTLVSPVGEEAGP